MPSPTYLYLADWRHRVTTLYAETRRLVETDPAAAHAHFRRERDALFASHPQTPLTTAQIETFVGLPYYSYNPGARVYARLDTAVEAETLCVELPADGLFRYTRVAQALFEWQGRLTALSLFWIEGYGGGLFLPFKDQSAPAETYGGGRYLIDTIKGADLGHAADEIVLDFNFAYNPSCAYNDGWVCPLAPVENALPFAINAGEKRFR